MTERSASSGWVAACNAAQGTQTGKTSLDRVLSDTPVHTLSDLQAILAHPEVLMGSNLYSVVFDFGGNRLLLASGDVPAAAGRFRTYPLFE
jgi:hypothetical protein